MTDTHTTAHIPDEDDTMRDKIIYVCEGCGTATHDPEGYAKKLKAIGALSCCPEHKYIECRAIPTALPHLSAPCAVEVKKLDWAETSYGTPEVFTEVGVYRINHAHDGGWSLNRNNKSIADHDGRRNFADQQKAKAAAQTDFERRILSCVVANPVDVAAVRMQAFEEGFENGVEQSLNAIDRHDDTTRQEALNEIKAMKPDYRALSAEPEPEEKA